MKKDYKKFNWFNFKGLPIAAASMVVLIIFMLAAGTMTNSFNSGFEEDNNIQGLMAKRETDNTPKPDRAAKKAKNTVNVVSQIDSILRDIDSLLKGKRVIDSINISDIK